MKIKNELQSSHNLELWKVLTPTTSRISLDSVESTGEERVPAQAVPSSPHADEASTSSSSASSSNTDMNSESVPLTSSSIVSPNEEQHPNGVVLKWIPKPVSVRTCFAKSQANGHSGSRYEMKKFKQKVKIGSQYEDCYPLLQSQLSGVPSRLPLKKDTVKAAGSQETDRLHAQSMEKADRNGLSTTIP